MTVDLTRIGKLHVGLVIAAGAMVAATQWGEPGSLILGGAVMGANFWLLHIIISALCRSAAHPDRQPQVTLGMVGMCLKLALFLGLLAALFMRLPIEGMSFAAGVTLLLVACVIEAARVERMRLKGVA